MDYLEFLERWVHPYAESVSAWVDKLVGVAAESLVLVVLISNECGLNEWVVCL